MKTTSYEISRKLTEVGFAINNASIFAYFSKPMVSPMELVGKFIVADGLKEGYSLDYYSFDLETILEALPDIIYSSDDFGLKKNEIGYYYFDYDHVAHGIYIEKEKDESLADTAARLLLTLHEKNLVKF